MFRGIRITMYWADHMPPHFHASYGGEEVLISITDLEVLERGNAQQTAQDGSWLGCIPSGTAHGKLGIGNQKTGAIHDRAIKINGSSPKGGVPWGIKLITTSAKVMIKKWQNTLPQDEKKSLK